MEGFSWLTLEWLTVHHGGVGGVLGGRAEHEAAGHMACLLKGREK